MRIPVLLLGWRRAIARQGVNAKMEMFIESVLGLGSCNPKEAEEGMRWIVMSVILILLWAGVMTVIADRQTRRKAHRTEAPHE